MSSDLAKKTELLAIHSEHLNQLRSWFSSMAQVKQWGGLHMHFPFEDGQFESDIAYPELASYGLFLNSELLAFGQYYLRTNRCHLGRLVVKPSYRNNGLAQRLIIELSRQGVEDLQVNEVSLFVLKDNLAAINLYHKMGFAIQPYVQGVKKNDQVHMSLEDIHYMITRNTTHAWDSKNLS